MKALIVATLVALACTQFTSELVTYRHDGTTEQVVIEREESGTLLINTTTGEMKFKPEKGDNNEKNNSSF